MENNNETLRMPELKALARERKLRGYSGLRKAEFFSKTKIDDKRNPPPENRNWKFRSL